MINQDDVADIMNDINKALWDTEYEAVGYDNTEHCLKVLIESKEPCEDNPIIGMDCVGNFIRANVISREPCDNDCEHCEWATCPKMETDEQAIEHLQKSGWMQRHDKALSEPYLCEDAISRKQALSKIHSVRTGHGIVQVIAVGDIEDLPSVQPTRPHGDWEYIKPKIEPRKVRCKCKLCGGTDVDDYPFCHLCGADMREGDNNG